MREADLRIFVRATMRRMIIPVLAIIFATSTNIALAAANQSGRQTSGFLLSAHAAPPSVLFTDSGRSFDSGLTFKIVLGDLDRDGDLDAFDVDFGGATVWFNRGGQFQDSGQHLDALDDRAAALGDI